MNSTSLTHKSAAQTPTITQSPMSGRPGSPLSEPQAVSFQAPSPRADQAFTVSLTQGLQAPSVQELTGPVRFDSSALKAARQQLAKVTDLTLLRDLLPLLRQTEPQALPASLAQLPAPQQALAQKLGLPDLSPEDLNSLTELAQEKLNQLSDAEHPGDPQAVTAAVEILKQNIVEHAREVAGVLRRVSGIVLNARINTLNRQELAAEVRQVFGQASPSEQALVQQLALEALDLNSLQSLGEKAEGLLAASQAAEDYKIQHRYHSLAELAPVGEPVDQIVNVRTGQAMGEVTSRRDPAEVTARAAAFKQRELETKGVENAILSSFSNVAELAQDKGFQGLLRILERLDADAIPMLQGILSHRPSGLDLRARQNYLVAQVLGTADETRLRSLQQAFGCLSEGGSLSQDQIALLQETGIGIQGNQAVNLAHPEQPAIPLAQLRTLAELAQQLQTSKLTGSDLSVVALKSTQNLIAGSIQQLAQIAGLRQEISLRSRKVEAERQQLMASNQSLQQAQQQAQTLASEVSQLDADLQWAQPHVQGLERDGVAYLEALAARGELATVNQLLARWQLAAVFQHGKLELREAGQVITPAAFQTRFQAGVQALAVQKRDREKQLEGIRERINVLQAQADAQASHLAAQVQILKTQQQELQRQAGHYRSQNLAELQALRQDPARWNALPPAVQAQITDLLQQSGQELEAVADTLQSVSRLTEACEQTLHLTDLLRAQSLALNEKLHQLLQGNLAQQALKQQLEGEARRLVAWANELEQKLMMAPRPENLDVGQLIQEWKSSLEQLDAGIKELLGQQLTRQNLEHGFAAQNYKQLQRRLDYHLRQLKGMDLRQTERIDQLLRSSLNRTRKELSVLVPQTSEGLRA